MFQPLGIRNKYTFGRAKAQLRHKTAVRICFAMSHCRLFRRPTAIDRIMLRIAAASWCP